MFSIFFGFSGAGGGGSSFFLGMTYGPTSFCGPPASGGASCWFGFCAGCCEGDCWVESCAPAAMLAAAIQKSAKHRRIRRLPEADADGFMPPNKPENIG